LHSPTNTPIDPVLNMEVSLFLSFRSVQEFLGQVGGREKLPGLRSGRR
jgi:hypothetical protein